MGGMSYKVFVFLELFIKKYMLPMRVDETVGETFSFCL